jgi:predicted ATPase/DNA-binding CsgD family transcriptional regulator
VGKTHLAATVAAAQKELFPDGMYYVNFALTRRWVLVLGVIAEAMHLPLSSQQGLPQLNEQLLKYLKDKRCLLFLDGLEHLTPASVLLEQLLSRCPKVKLLLTSRAALRSPSEQVLALSPLAVATDIEGLETQPERLLEASSAELFVTMVQEQVPSFIVGKDNARALAKLTWELDGLPFALELAALQLGKRTPSALLKELSGPYLPNWEVADKTPFTQHENLRDSLQWSYDLLTEKQRLVLRHAQLFGGTFKVSALSAVLGTDKLIAEDVAEILNQLVWRQLVRLENSHNEGFDEPRYSLLRLVKRFAYEQFERLDDLPQSHLRYLEYYQHQVDNVLPNEASKETWLRLERPNLEAALGYVKDAYHVYTSDLSTTLVSLLSTLTSQVPEVQAATEAPVSATPAVQLENLTRDLPETPEPPKPAEFEAPESDPEEVLVDPLEDEVFEGRKRQKEPLHIPVVKEQDSEFYEELTEREQEVLRLVATGLSNREIAEELQVSPRTVGAHLANIFSKLNVKTRTAAVRKAVSLELQVPPPRA